jgi:ribosomal protein S18 acetylase RimI-like enzyme
MTLTIDPDGHWPEALDQLLRGLPEWFGIEASILGYVDAARTLPTTCAVLDGEVVGACVVRHHTPVASEIEVLAVRRDLHRTGVGRTLLAHVEAGLRSGGVKLLQVKTRGPSAASQEYERTRAFYEALGYLPLEERADIWGPENPCLFMVKPLASSP